MWQRRHPQVAREHGGDRVEAWMVVMGGGEVGVGGRPRLARRGGTSRQVRGHSVASRHRGTPNPPCRPGRLGDVEGDPTHRRPSEDGPTESYPPAPSFRKGGSHHVGHGDPRPVALEEHLHARRARCADLHAIEDTLGGLGTGGEPSCAGDVGVGRRDDEGRILRDHRSGAGGRAGADEHVMAVVGIDGDVAGCADRDVTPGRLARSGAPHGLVRTTPDVAIEDPKVACHLEQEGAARAAERATALQHGMPRGAAGPEHHVAVRSNLEVGPLRCGNGGRRAR